MVSLVNVSISMLIDRPHSVSVVPLASLDDNLHV